MILINEGPPPPVFNWSTVHWFADALVSACAFCHRTFDTDADHYKWDRKVEDLVQLVADHLIDE